MKQGVTNGRCWGNEQGTGSRQHKGDDAIRLDNMTRMVGNSAKEVSAGSKVLVALEAWKVREQQQGRHSQSSEMKPGNGNSRGRRGSSSKQH